MFTILNRLRGTKGYWSHITGLLIGYVFLMFTHDNITAIGLTVAYVFGESFGWGKWIGGIYSGNAVPTRTQLLDYEGRNNGIHFIANLISPEHKNYYRYCYTALFLRGSYWFGIALLPLVIGGYIQIADYIVASLLLGWGFPLSVKIGVWSTKRFNFYHRQFGMNGFWEHAEVWYGVMQDLVLLSLILIWRVT